MAATKVSQRRELVEYAARFNHEMARLYALKLARNLDELHELDAWQSSQGALSMLDDCAEASEVIDG